MNAIEARKLTKIFGREEGRVGALAGVSPDVERGRAVHAPKTVIRPLAARRTDGAR